MKDWKIDTLHAADRHQVTLLTSNGLTRASNPLEQARNNAMRVEIMLRQDPALRNPPGHAWPGKLITPWGWGAVLTNITRKQFDEKNLGEVMEPAKVICKDEMTESVDAEAFQSRLWAMFQQKFACDKLSLPQIERIRWHLFPELRLSTQQGTFGVFDEQGTKKTFEIPDLIKVMDTHQEQLARSLGDGHRVIHGVAGSGKSMILGFRCLHLARQMQKPILVLCFNVTLAARLRQLLEQRGVGEQVSVRSFHDWCGDLLTTYQVPKPPYDPNYDRRTRELVQRAIDGVDRGQIPRAQYGAVLIDEGHDLEPEWLKLVVQMVDPATNSVLVLYDDAQSIYAKGKRRKFSFASVGIQAQGRTSILRLNYRNTLEILSVAKAFAEELLNPQDADEDSAPVIAPETAGRRGPMPQLIHCGTALAEAQLIAERIDDERAQGRSLSDIAVIPRYINQADLLTLQLDKRGIQYRVARSQDDKRNLFQGDPAVKIVTMHSSKGLEFGATYIPRLCEMPKKDEDENDEARLLYVAMTRATERLVMTRGGESGFAGRVEGVILGIEHSRLIRLP